MAPVLCQEGSLGHSVDLDLVPWFRPLARGRDSGSQKTRFGPPNGPRKSKFGLGGACPRPKRHALFISHTKSAWRLGLVHSVLVQFWGLRGASGHRLTPQWRSQTPLRGSIVCLGTPGATSPRSPTPQPPGAHGKQFRICTLKLLRAWAVESLRQSPEGPRQWPRDTYWASKWIPKRQAKLRFIFLSFARSANEAIGPPSGPKWDPKLA